MTLVSNTQRRSNLVPDGAHRLQLNRYELLRLNHRRYRRSRTRNVHRPTKRERAHRRTVGEESGEQEKDSRIRAGERKDTAP